MPKERQLIEASEFERMSVSQQPSQSIYEVNL
ncbi:hypothetical protein QFZ77_003145 [Paenibacillus sp. V4I3]|nr:hypothetical protein [Paenibacillus sp. V4I3]